MADVFEQNLPSKTTLATSDYIRVVGSDNASYKQLVSSVMATMGLLHDDLGSFANESALVTALNTKLNAIIAGTSAYIRIAITANFGAFTNGVTYIGELRKSSANYASISFYGLGINIELIGNKTPSGWDFQRQPSRSEIEALNSKSVGLSNATSITLTMSNTPSSAHFGNAFIINANVGTVAMARIDTNPTVTALHGTITYSISVSGNTYTITPSSRLWGLTQVFFNEV